MSTDTQVEGAAAGAIAPPAQADDWWQSLSPDELRDMINRGFAGGDLFTGATAEAERRSRETRRATEKEAAVSRLERTRARRKTLVLAVLVAVSMGATLGTLWVVITHLWPD
jgi:hypothetical protein